MGWIGREVLQRLDLKPLNLTKAPPEPEPAPEPVQETAAPEPAPAR
jgi:hypothetical protein